MDLSQFDPAKYDPVTLLKKIDGKTRGVVHRCGQVLAMTNILDEKTRRMGVIYRDPDGHLGGMSFILKLTGKKKDGLHRCPSCKAKLVNFYDDEREEHFRRQLQPVINLVKSEK